MWSLKRKEAFCKPNFLYMKVVREGSKKRNFNLPFMDSFFIPTKTLFTLLKCFKNGSLFLPSKRNHIIQVRKSGFQFYFKPRLKWRILIKLHIFGKTCFFAPMKILLFFIIVVLRYKVFIWFLSEKTLILFFFFVFYLSNQNDSYFGFVPPAAISFIC